MATKHKLWALGLAGLLLFAVLNHALNPLRWSHENLREWLLEKVPLGSSVAHLKSAVDKEGWRVMSIWEHGDTPPHIGVQGDTVVRVDLGGYRGLLFRVEMDSYWVFDESDRLLDVQTKREADSL